MAKSVTPVKKNGKTSRKTAKKVAPTQSAGASPRAAEGSGAKAAKKKSVRKAVNTAAQVADKVVPKKVIRRSKTVAKGGAKAVVTTAAKKVAKKGVKGETGASGAVRAGRRTIVRRSPIHGLGVFAGVDIAKGERVIEYKARKITWAQADRWYADDESKPSHTFLFTLDDKYVLDGNKDGNSARWINHSCKPNCESDVVDGRIWIEALRDIKAGEELNYDYNITLDAPHTPAEKRRWSCRCGSSNCRGTLLGKKR